MAHVLILTVSFPDVPFDNIEAKLDKALDWIRYAPGCWLIYTEHSAQTWYSKIFELPELTGALVFLCEANLEDRSGHMSPLAWDWIKKIREESHPAPIHTPDEQTIGAL